MSTVTQIKLALKARLATLTDVDQADIDSYLPPVLTKRIALVIPPFGQETRVDRLTSEGRFQLAHAPVMQSHRLRCEFWVRLTRAIWRRPCAGPVTSRLKPSGC